MSSCVTKATEVVRRLPRADVALPMPFLGGDHGNKQPKKKKKKEAFLDQQQRQQHDQQDGDAVECRFQTVAAALRPCCWPALQHNQLTPALESNHGTDYQLARTVPLRK